MNDINIKVEVAGVVIEPMSRHGLSFLHDDGNQSHGIACAGCKQGWFMDKALSASDELSCGCGGEVSAITGTRREVIEFFKGIIERHDDSPDSS